MKDELEEALLYRQSLRDQIVELEIKLEKVNTFIKAIKGWNELKPVLLDSKIKDSQYYTKQEISPSRALNIIKEEGLLTQDRGIYSVREILEKLKEKGYTLKLHSLKCALSQSSDFEFDQYRGWSVKQAPFVLFGNYSYKSSGRGSSHAVTI